MLEKKNRERGFTLIEVLICIAVLFLLAALTPRLAYLFVPSSAKGISEFEWTLCLEQIQMEFREARDVQNYERTLIMHNIENKAVTHIVRGDNLVRKVDGKGYEILLQNINNVSYEVFPSKLVIYIEDNNHEKHTGIVTRFYPAEVRL
jgi:competence protein ComGF